MHAYVRDVMTTGVVAVRADTPYREMTAPGSAVLGASIVEAVRHLEGVVAVRDRFSYPDAEGPSGL